MTRISRKGPRKLQAPGRRSPAGRAGTRGASGQVLALAGSSGSGKTTLIEKLIARLAARGRRVAYLKHDAHRFQMDRPGKDTWRAMEAGASAVAIASAEQWVWLARVGIPGIDELVRRALAVADVCLVEGYHGSHHPKILVFRKGVPLRVVRPWRTVIATYGDDPPRGRGGVPKTIPHFGWDEVDPLFGKVFASSR
jgi:molybdopterin-guanine dinucleotide biosynthesis protein MobB